MVTLQEQSAKIATFIDHVHGLLGQGWFYQGSPPGRDQSECRITECFDLLALLAELIGDIQQFAEACEGFVVEGRELLMSEETLKLLIGLDLAKMAEAHRRLAVELSTAANRAVDLIGEARRVD